MFFIVPPSAPEPSSTAPRQSASSSDRPVTALGDVGAYYRRRVAAACYRCRLKKARCSGGPAPCNKCKRDRVICVISKDKKPDSQPKAPAYVRMVESQRDLLLKAIHELRQKCTASQQTGTKWDASSDINRVLRELGVHIDDSEVVHDSIVEELATRQRVYKDAEADLPGLEADPSSWPNNTSSRTHLSIASSVPQIEPTHSQQNGELAPPPASKVTATSDTTFDTTFDDDDELFNDTTLMKDWPSSTSDVCFGFHNPMNHAFLNMETLQEQTWQNGNVPRDNYV